MKERDYFKDLDLDRIILKLILRNYDGRVWAGFIWPRIYIVFSECDE